ncbi:MAG: hypothetical protein UE295_08700 [Acutalibacteraceae bacterium]|nr:hypothetical protein [Acutalibacteraceae bacterium]
MEELLAYALLIYAGFDVEEKYQSKLDELFLANPTDDFLLELEAKSGNIKESIIYISMNLNTKFKCGNSYNLNYDIFGKALMDSLKPFYKNTELILFAEKGWYLWNSLPDVLWQTEPFWSLCYADDPLSHGDEAKCREFYENMFNYYDDE